MLCRRFQCYKSLAGLWLRPAKYTFQTFSTAVQDDDEGERFKAAVLHPNRQSLAIETMVNRTKLDDGMLRIGIEYCSVSAADLRCMTHLNDVTLPYIPGSEFGGKVLEVGANCAQKLKPGDTVAILSDEIHVGGGLSQQCVVDSSICIPLNDKISVENAVTVLRAYGNAQLAFTKYCPLKENDTIVVIAGPDGNGLAAIEVASKIHKANVFVVFDSDNVKALIRDEVAYRGCSAQAGLTKVYTVLDGSLKNKKLKAIYDTTGSGIMHVVSDFLDPSGHILTDDKYFTEEKCERPYFKRIQSRSKTKKTDSKAPTEARAPSSEWAKKVQIVNLAKYRASEPILFNKIVKDVFSLLIEKKINPFISATYSLADVNKAVRFVQRKKCLGKVLIELNEAPRT